MKVICAWCKVILQDDPKDNQPVSHGICKACKEKMLEELRNEKGGNTNEVNN
jgi:hypothetical protein